MKKRIIATILLVVMVLGTLASCGSYKFSDDKDFGHYAYVTDYNALLTALKNIVVDDVDFAIDETERNETVKEQIYSKLADALVKVSANKLTNGAIGGTDVVEYYYYCTVTVDGVEYRYDFSKMGGAATSVKLPLVDEEDELQTKIKNTLLGATLTTDHNYKITTSGSAAKDKTYVVSYTVESETFDKDGNSVGSKEPEVVSFEKITLNDVENNKLHAQLVNGSSDSENKPTIGTGSGNIKSFDIEEAEGEGKKITSYTDFTIHYQLDNEENGYTLTHTYDEDKEIKTAIDSDHKIQTITIPAETEITYHVYPTTRVEVTMDVTAEQIVRDILGSSIKTNSVSIFAQDEETKYTYVVLDYLRYEADEEGHKKGDIKYDADGKLQYEATKDDAGADITKEATLYEIVDLLVKEHAKDKTKAYADVDAVKNAKAALDAATEDLKTKEEAYNTAKAAYDAAKKVVDDAGEAATDEQKADLATKETAMKDAEAAKNTASTAKTNANTAHTKAQTDTKDANVEILTRRLLEATRTEGETTVTSADDIAAAYTKQTYAELESAHDTALTEAIGKEVWEILVANVTVDLDHKNLQKTIKKYKDTLYEQYEYQYYKGTSNNASNYSQYDSVEEYIKTTIKNDPDFVADDKYYNKNVTDIDEALQYKAEETLRDQLVVYAVAKALATEETITLYKNWIAENEDEWKAIYKHSHEHNDSELSDEEIQEQFEEYYDSIEKEADNLLVTNKVMKDYKKEVGRVQYNLYVDTYGEENLRMTLQFTRLMNLLLYTDYALDTHAAHEGEYKIAYSGNKIAYRFIQYKLQSEVDAENTNP